MHWEEVAGYRMPSRVGGHPALDFCNTWAGWGAPPHPRREWLPDYPHLAVWARHAGLLTQATCTRLRQGAESGRDTAAQAAEVLGQAHELRTALYAVLLESAEPTAFATVAAHAERAAAASSLVPAAAPSTRGAAGRDDTPRARWELSDHAGLALPLLAAAHSAAALLTGPGRPRIDACPGHDCGWLFLNPRGRRRWCSMSSCGNRAKVHAHARRRREGGTRD
ncbi:CGNR zinc finger domain-containing protein [Streptomyces sp. NPDC006925]|uniref:CGNR zinc finger domain-containing protein n=1 Tax=Streptomyces sp. NPDC006925 TaxID=3364768 RepID=UPI003692E466